MTIALDSFNGVRIRIDTTLAFDGVLERLHEQCGTASVAAINETAERTNSAEAFEEEVKRRFVGPGGFMVFAEIEHTRWIKSYGLETRLLRIILGNPLYAITMLREDISAGLFVPPEFLLVATPQGSRIEYVQPSSQIAISEDSRLKEAAEDLDSKFAKLMQTISAV